MHPAYQLHRAAFRYPDTVALADVTLDLAAGQRVAVLGANGSGKSTLLRLLAGLAFADSGTIAFDGRALTAAALDDDIFAREFRRRVGIVFQNPDAQLFNPTVFDEIAFGPLQLGMAKPDILERVRATLDDMGISHLRDRSPHRLSGGEKKRVALASVLACDPDVLLMDEPTASLDPHSQSHMIDYLAGCGGSKTVVTTTHDLEIIGEIADRCVVLAAGMVAACGTPEEILGDRDLLARTGLIHIHRHRHDGIAHSHPHALRHHHHASE